MSCQFKELTDGIKKSHMTGIKSKEFITIIIIIINYYSALGRLGRHQSPVR